MAVLTRYVKQGIVRNGIVAVKRLFKSRAIKNKMFHREVKSLITVRHQNIVRFLGYCSFTEERMVSIEGGTIVVDIQERLLCFEYMSNGSLDSHLTGTLSSSCYLLAGFFPILYLDLCYKSFFSFI
jgi:coatomer subunit beta'